SDVTKDGFFQRIDVVDSMDKWTEACFENVDYSSEWGELPKQQIERVCYDELLKQGFLTDEANKMCDCYMRKVIKNVEPGHISDINADTLRRWIKNCIDQNR